MMYKGLCFLILNFSMSSFKNLGLHMFADLPSNIQKAILYNVVKIDKQILDFNLKPNSTWTAYEIKDETKILEKIPSDLELTTIKIFKYSKPIKTLFFNFFKVDSTYLSGNRLEVVTVVRDKKNNKKRFIILDYYSDTISSDPEHCIKKPNAKKMKLVNSKTEIGGYMENKYVFMGIKDEKESRMLSSEFAVSCNKNIYYGSIKPHLPNYLEFDKESVSTVHFFKKVELVNYLWKESIVDEPFIVFYFPQPLFFKIQIDKLCNQEEDDYEKIDEIEN